MRAEAPETKVPVAILGATGSVGQRFVSLLAAHPWFQVAALTASDTKAEKPYGDAVRWVQSTPLPEAIAAMKLLRSGEAFEAPLAFSALDASVAGPIEEELASSGVVVVSNAKSHRLEPDVPLVVPEVNPSHVELARRSRHRPGAILTNPNCSTIGLVLALKPLWDAFGILRTSVTTMQAVSGAGLPGISSYEILDNVVPYIDGEEEKLEVETRKILGVVSEDGIGPAKIEVSAQCHRVPVLDGHTLAISVELARKTSVEEIRRAFRDFSGEPQTMSLPSAPRRPVHYLDDERSPQPRLHRDLEGGMAVSVGRLRPCSVLDFKFVALSHNTVRGAAGGAILLAELAMARGILDPSKAPSVKTTA